MKSTIIILLSVVCFTSCEKVSKTEHASEGSALEETITREQQRTIRYNCKDQVTSDKIETINSVSKQFYFSPKIKKIFMISQLQTKQQTQPMDLFGQKEVYSL